MNELSPGSAMTERDYWTEELRCPKCKAKGSVALSQAAPASRAYHDGIDQNVRVELAPDEFNVAVIDLGCQFYCAHCGASAHHF